MRPSRPVALLLATLLVADLLVPVATARAQGIEVSESDYVGWTPWISTLALPPYYFNHSLYPLNHYPGGSLKLPMDPRVLQVRVDPGVAEVTTTLAAADVTIGPTRSESFEQYADRMTERNLRSGWVKSSRER